MRCTLQHYLHHNRLAPDQRRALAADVAAWAVRRELPPSAERVLIEQTRRRRRFSAAPASAGRFLDGESSRILPPEHREAEGADDFDEAARVFLAAVLAWEYLAGSPPWDVRHLEPGEAVAVLRDQPAAGLSLPDWVDDDAACALRAALALEPSARPGAKEFLLALRKPQPARIPWAALIALLIGLALVVAGLVLMNP